MSSQLNNEKAAKTGQRWVFWGAVGIALFVVSVFVFVLMSRSAEAPEKEGDTEAEVLGDSSNRVSLLEHDGNAFLEEEAGVGFVVPAGLVVEEIDVVDELTETRVKYLVIRPEGAGDDGGAADFEMTLGVRSLDSDYVIQPRSGVQAGVLRESRIIEILGTEVITYDLVAETGEVLEFFASDGPVELAGNAYEFWAFMTNTGDEPDLKNVEVVVGGDSGDNDGAATSASAEDIFYEVIQSLEVL